MKVFRSFFLLIVSLCIFSCKAAQEKQTLTVSNFGAVNDGVTDCTEAFNEAIRQCSQVNGVVMVPEGQYLCRTIHMQSNVELHLCKGAEIIGHTDADAYDSFVPQRDMTCYDSGDGTVNQNNSKDARWNHALILANSVENIAVTGEGTVNGRHVFDPQGEEYMRGPHTFVFGDCKNVRLEGINIVCAANYAFMGYALTDATFKGVSIKEGWDGIHIRGGQNVLIEGCSFETGDDSIAGGYWNNMEIRDCYLNSSCNGLRMIMPSDGVEIHHCRFEGPGHYPHRTSGEAHRTNMLFGIVFEPGGWGAAPGDMKNLYVHDCTIDHTSSPIAASVAPECHAYDLTVSDVKATGTYGTLTPLVNYNDSGFDCVKVNNYSIEK